MITFPDSEKLVLGSLIKSDCWDEVSFLTEDCFSSATNREIFKGIKKIIDRGEKPDILFIRYETEIPVSSIVDLPMTFDVYPHARVIQEAAQKNKLTSTLESLKPDDSIEEMIAKINLSIEQVLTNREEKIRTLKDATEDVIGIINDNIKGKTRGVKTGFTELDRHTGGLHPGDFTIIAARESMGKTSFALNIAKNVASHGAKVAFYSLEMNDVQLTSRIISSVSGLSSKEILYRSMSNEMIKEFDKGVGKIQDLEIYFDDRSTSSIDTIVQSIRKMVFKYGISIVFIDYLQTIPMTSKVSSKEQFIGHMAHRLKNLAEELNIGITALSQLNRQNGDNPPALSDLRESGQIAEAADNVMLLYRPEVYGRSYPAPFASTSTQGTALINFAKGRNVGITKFILGFKPEQTLFYNLDELPENVPF
jgi:replicative DNA helicase